MSWPEIAIEEVADVKGGKRLPKGHDFVNYPTQHPYIRARDIGEGKIEIKDYVYLSEETHSLIKRYIVNKDNVVITIVGANVGDVGYVGESLDGANLTENAAKLIVNKKKFNPYFLKLFLSTDQSKKRLAFIASGAAQGKLGLYKIKSFTVSNPALDIQNRVVEIAEKYDELIENNKRRIELLEESARQLYKEWFVRFRFPGHEHVKVIDGVPEGWDKGVISDFYDTSSGGTPSRKYPDFYTGDINWIKTQELDERFIFQTEERITDEAISKSSAKIFPAKTVLVSMYGGTNIGRTCILGAPAASNQACCAFYPKDERAHYIFTSLYFYHTREKLISISQGAAQTNISQQVIKGLDITLPPIKLAREFIEILLQGYEQINNLQRQNQNLVKARDILLPKLMSGEIIV